MFFIQRLVGDRSGEGVILFKTAGGDRELAIADGKQAILALFGFKAGVDFDLRTEKVANGVAGGNSASARPAESTAACSAVRSAAARV